MVTAGAGDHALAGDKTHDKRIAPLADFISPLVVRRARPARGQCALMTRAVSVGTDDGLLMAAGRKPKLAPRVTSDEPRSELDGTGSFGRGGSLLSGAPALAGRGGGSWGVRDGREQRERGRRERERRTAAKRAPAPPRSLDRLGAGKRTEVSAPLSRHFLSRAILA